MYNVIQLVIKYGSHLAFIILQIICFYLIINYNASQKDIFLNSSNIYTAKIAEQTAKVTTFANLQALNDSLMHQNSTLIENLITIEYNAENIPPADSIYNPYELIPSTICNSTINLRNNHFTLCKGSREGIKPDMGVISATNGIVGIVRNTSDNFAHVMSLLNSQTRISCTIKRRKSHGVLIWKSFDPLRMNLESVPKHETISIGDTVITSGYSTVFPRGILVGKIESYTIPLGSNTYNIVVKLFNDLTGVKYAYVIQNRFAEEQKALENEVKHE